MPSFSKARFKNKISIPKRRQVRIINGLKIDKLESPNLFNVKSAEARLNTLGIIKLPQEGGEELNLKESSQLVLGAIGCTFSNENSDFSLLTKQTDKEIIDNERLLDEIEWTRIENESIFATDKFINISNDPFYKLDDDIPHRLQNHEDKKKKKEIPDATIITSDVVIYNVNPVTDKLKQF
jgi:hypothetical protein